MAASDINTGTLVEMSELIEKLTTSGKPSLDEKTCKQFKKICRLSDSYVKRAYHLLMVQLKKEHAEIRLSTAQIINELFLRSHCFRELLLANFQHFMELTLETDLKKPFPPPVRVARELKKQCTNFVLDWFTKFGDTYKQLALGYNFLKGCKKIDFENIQARTAAEVRLEEEKRAKLELYLRTRANAAVEEMAEMSAEIRLCLTEANNCIKLLVPDPETFDIFETRIDNDNDDKSASVLPPLQQKMECLETEEKKDGVYDDSGSGLKSDIEHRTGKEQTCTNDAINCEEVHGTCHAETECVSGAVNDHCKTDKGENILLAADLSASPIQHQGQLLDENEVKKSEKTDEIQESENEEENVESGDEDIEPDIDDRESRSRVHGILSHKTSMNITFNATSLAICETRDNEDLLVTLCDQVSLASNKLLPLVKKWLNTFIKAGGYEKNVRTALDLKLDLEGMLKKANKLNIVEMPHPSKSTNAEGDSDEDDDDDFEEVPMKEGYEPFIPDCMREEYGLSPRRPLQSQTTNDNYLQKIKKQADLAAEDPTSWAATIKRMKELQRNEPSAGRIPIQDTYEPQPSTSKDDPSTRKNREELLKKAPVIPFGTDLYHWGDKIEPPLIVRNDTESLRWWKPQQTEDSVDVLALAARKQRTINFVGRFEPVKWTCRAPLANGKLCIRMDRYKCPFHGKIIPRDDQGVPNGQEKQEVEENIFEAKSNGWDDPELQADIFAATGIDLSLKKKKKGKGKGKKYPDLSDIKSLHNDTARKRLEAKVFNAGAVKRVSSCLNELDAKRYKDKFGNNFNYSCQS